MAKSTAKKKHTQATTKRFLLMIDELIKSGKCQDVEEFMTSIGEHRQNIYDYKNGRRSPTIEQMALACIKYGYSPTWLILGIGEKQILVKGKMDIDHILEKLDKKIIGTKNLFNTRAYNKSK